MSGSEIQLVGVGAGSGRKEARLARALGDAGCVVHFTAVDVSEALASEAAEAVGKVAEGDTRALVGDFREADKLSRMIANATDDRRNLITGFGLSPNLLPPEFFPRVRCLLDAGASGKSIVLVSANLWPKGSHAERELLPQYDNQETRAWLLQLFVNWGMTGSDCPELEFGIGEIDGIAAVQVFVTWPDLARKVSNLCHRWSTIGRPETGSKCFSVCATRWKTSRREQRRLTWTCAAIDRAVVAGKRFSGWRKSPSLEQ